MRSEMPIRDYVVVNVCDMLRSRAPPLQEERDEDHRCSSSPSLPSAALPLMMF